MDTALQVTFRGLPPSPALDRRIRDKAARLQALSGRITRFRITVERRHRHQRQGREYGVRVELHVPERDIVVTHEEDEDVYVALRDAFEAAERQLKRSARAPV
ncbi:MAG TPA: HPF/RaiA family ribosome-associated protein [Burkholderiales bacterium]